MMDDCPVVSIFKEDDDLVTVRTGDGRTYEIVHDDRGTGDWLVTSTDDNRIMSDWFLTQDGATQYLLQELSVIKDADYTFAPDRC